MVFLYSRVLLFFILGGVITNRTGDVESLGSYSYSVGFSGIYSICFL